MKQEIRAEQPDVDPQDNIKEELRRFYKLELAKINPSRRKEAESAALQAIPSILESHLYILSFQSYSDEISTHQFNESLAKQNRLLLPRIENSGLVIYRVHDLSRELTKNGFGILEPMPEFCEKVSHDKLTLVIIPGLAFDIQGDRLGRGKGYYDRFLATLPSTVLRWGLGFKEQLHSSGLPTMPSDIAMHKLLLY